MPTKKFSGRKLQAEDIFIHISGDYDKGRILLNDQDTPIATIFNNIISNDIQYIIMEYLGEKSAVSFTDEPDDYEEEGMYDEDDFIIDEEEREQERYEAMMLRREHYV